MALCGKPAYSNCNVLCESRPCTCLFSRGHAEDHYCLHHTWPDEAKDADPLVKRNCWGVPMADEVIERQGCCKEEEEIAPGLTRKDLHEEMAKIMEAKIAYALSVVAQEELVDISEWCKNTHPHMPHRWRTGYPADRVYVQCLGVKELVKGTKENPHRAYLYAPSYYCKGCKGVCVSYIDTKLQQCSACGAWNNLV